MSVPIIQILFSSVTQLCPILCNPMNRSMPGLPVHHQLLESTQTHVQWVSDAIQPSYPLSSPSPPTFNPSQHQGLFKWVTLCIKWPKYWSFSLNISPSNEYSGLISFTMDWLDLLAVQGTLKNLLQHHSSKASILQHSALFIIQLSHPYMTTGKTIALTRWTFVGKVMSLFFNMLSRLVITFLPRSRVFSFHSCGHHLQWFWSPKNKVWHCFHCFSIYLPWSDGTRCHDFKIIFWMLSFKPVFSLSSFTFIKRCFSSSSLSALRVVSSAYLRLLIFLPAILIPACA